MPNDVTTQTILVIGSGPTTVGHGTEYNLAAWKACRTIKRAGHRVIALDNTPASLIIHEADRAYVEPLTADTIRRIIDKEHPSAILPVADGQTGLNLCMQVADDLEAQGVAVLGIPPDMIRAVGDRVAFAELVEKAGGRSLPSESATSPEQAAAAASRLGFPVVLRPFYVIAGPGSSVVYNFEELKDSTFRAIKHSPVAKTLIEKAALGWREVICQVLRDCRGNCIVAGIIETIDPMGVHSGDSAAVFPAQSLTKAQLGTISEVSRKLAGLAGITSSADIEFAVNPRDPAEIVVMEMNPGITRFSALISFATGFSTVDAAIRLALCEQLAAVCPQPPQPSAVAVRVPRFAFEKFPGARTELNTVMKSIGESIGLGGSFREAFQKALRGLATGRDGIGFDGHEKTVASEEATELRKRLSPSQPDNFFHIKSALELGMSVNDVAAATGIAPFFINEIRALLDMARQLQRHELTADLLRMAKAEGFSDAQIAVITGRAPAEIAELRTKAGVVPAYPEVAPQVRYTSFTKAGNGLEGDRPRILMIGPGPNTIGCGSEYEFCISRAAAAFREAGYSVVSVNCSCQGPSADPGQWDALFVVPLVAEDVLSVAKLVNPHGVSVQFGGPLAIALSEMMVQHGYRILGTAPESHKRCYCREQRRAMLDKLGMLQPKDEIVASFDEARAAAAAIGYPVVVRAIRSDDGVLSPAISPPAPAGKAMEVIYNAADFEKVKDFFQRPNGQRMLIAEFLEDAIEIEVDAVADGESLLIGGIVEHIEEAGIHAGDSACAIPPYTVSESVIKQMREQVQAIAAELGVRGLLNVQFAIKNDLIYVVEVLSSASLSVPFICRATDLPLISIAARVTIGQTLKQQGFTREKMPQQMAVRHSVFPFARFQGVDTVLGPEMKSTGQVMGISDTFGLAFAKALIGAGQHLPTSGKVFISLKNKDKRPMLFIAKKLEELGFKLLATRGTALALAKNDVKVELISKVSEGRPNVVDLITNGEVALIINTPSRKTPSRDEVSIRASAVAHNVPLITTVSGASAAVNAIERVTKCGMDVE
ncbi:MAG TPA: carbamoyl-phosphate synthase large subunit [Planctomycetota bacterium]|nr:carbamoyl-phosphate synthase large subunit [Planctomycetota bacterium]